MTNGESLPVDDRLDIPAYKEELFLWSGGLDSSFMIYEYIKNPGVREVHFGFIDQGVPERMKQEHIARQQLLEKFKSLFPNVEFLDQGCMLVWKKSEETKNLQAIFSHHGYLIVAASSYYKRVNIGVLQDDLIRPTMKKTQAFISSALKGRSMNFPLETMTKQDVWDSCPEFIRELAWYCDTPSGPEPCGKCPSCLKVAAIKKPA